jgi:hypothetical protein
VKPSRTAVFLAVAGLFLAIGGVAFAAEPLASAETNWDGVVLDLMAVERKGSVLTVKWAMRNEGDEQQSFDFNLKPDRAMTYAVDEESGTKYYVLTDEEGNLLSSSNYERIYDRLPAGKTKRYWMKLPAPPPEVTTLTLFFDETEPLEDVPITDK